MSVISTNVSFSNPVKRKSFTLSSVSIADSVLIIDPSGSLTGIRTQIVSVGRNKSSS
jgi:hypothetical protein